MQIYTFSNIYILKKYIFPKIHKRVRSEYRLGLAGRGLPRIGHLELGFPFLGGHEVLVIELPALLLEEGLVEDRVLLHEVPVVRLGVLRLEEVPVELRFRGLRDGG